MTRSKVTPLYAANTGLVLRVSPCFISFLAYKGKSKQRRHTRHNTKHRATGIIPDERARSRRRVAVPITMGTLPLLTTRDLGLPSKFSLWRFGELAAVMQTTESAVGPRVEAEQAEAVARLLAGTRAAWSVRGILEPKGTALGWPQHARLRAHTSPLGRTRGDTQWS